MKFQDYEKEHLLKIRPYLPECMVLLKKSGAFPLREAGKIAAFGRGVRHTIKGGTGSGEVNSRTFFTIEEGLERMGFEITTKEWLSDYDAMLSLEEERFIETIKLRAKKNHTLPFMEGMGAVMPEPEHQIKIKGEGDTAIYVVSRISGEGNDREIVSGDVLLSQKEIEDILYCNAHYKNFMLVLNVGGVVDLTPVKDVKDILLLSQLGVETGTSLARVLLGRQVPSGKLSTTWASVSSYPQAGTFGDINDTYYKEGIYVGYRYFDSAKVEPLFPFGHGLSYTDFQISPGAVTVLNDEVAIQVEVKNIGALKGKETVQAYVSKPQGYLDEPYQILSAFQKTKELLPDEKMKLCLSFKMKDLASFDEGKAAYVLSEGYYTVRVGSSSRNTVPVCAIHLVTDVLVRLVKNAFDDEKTKDRKPKRKLDVTVPEGIQVIEMPISSVKTEIVSYNRKWEIDETVDEMSDEELALLNCGYFDPKKGILSVVGSQSQEVPGAAGETANGLEEYGMEKIIMADGPAGIRLSKVYIENKKGKKGLSEGLPESMLAFMPDVMKAGMKLLSGPKPKGEKHFQYATAIPIGTALAQSFNLEMIEQIGEIVGEEANCFGVHLWLAPALNIHRTILCGRNFEYYSEDPFVSGKVAAAMTRGVQKNPHVGVTIKHFAANNQEKNRYFNNSHVSERALREIYLKGFEICVKEANPFALMTSYNLLNGIHTSERRDLIEDVLRNEWGFSGIVMTDWIIASGFIKMKGSIYRAPEASRIAMAGHELVMPGSKSDYKDILEGLSDGRVSRKQLKVNATRLIRMSKRLHGE